jgi:glycosyltransferase involved in cell wall biosynthesis
MKPLVSIIIPAKNEEKTLPKTIKSIKKSVNVPFELIVVDNNSTDKTSTIAKQLGAKVYKQKEPSIAKTRNLGAKKANAPLLLFIDADTKISRKLFETSFKKLKTEKIKAVSCFSSFTKYPKLSSYGVWFFNLASKIVKLGMGQFIFIKKEVFKGFDEELYAFEDLNLINQIKSKYGYKSVYINYIPVKTSPRKFEDGHDTALFLQQMISFMFNKNVGKNKEKLKYWYGKADKKTKNYKGKLLAFIALLLAFNISNNFVYLDIEQYNEIAITIIFILLSYLVLESYKLPLIFGGFTLVTEIVGVKTGIIFGEYSYTGNLAILGVPFFIPFAWIYVVKTASKLSNHFAITGLLSVAFDILIEEFSITTNLWSWNSSFWILEAPLENYVAWFVIGCIGHFFFKDTTHNKLFTFFTFFILVNFMTIKLMITGNNWHFYGIPLVILYLIFGANKAYKEVI